MASRQTSSQCALSSCSNLVRLDNPSFPYCSRYHSHLKDARSPFEERMNNASTSQERESIFKERWVPEMTFIPPSTLSDSTVARYVPGVDVPFASFTRRVWSKTTRGVNMMVPSQAVENSEKVLSVMTTALSKKYGKDNISPLDLRGGMMLVNGDYLSVDDHSAILVNRKDNLIVVDPATTAPLSSFVPDGDTVDGYIEMGSPLGDGMSTVSLVEMAAYSDITWDTISSNGQLVWDNRDSFQTDYDDQIALVESSPDIVPAPVRTYGSAVLYGEDPEETIEKNNSIDFDEIVEKDLEGLPKSYRQRFADTQR